MVMVLTWQPGCPTGCSERCSLRHSAGHTTAHVGAAIAVLHGRAANVQRLSGFQQQRRAMIKPLCPSTFFARRHLRGKPFYMIYTMSDPRSPPARRAKFAVQLYACGWKSIMAAFSAALGALVLLTPCHAMIWTPKNPRNFMWDTWYAGSAAARLSVVSLIMPLFQCPCSC
jgi:hypothetical protein